MEKISNTKGYQKSLKDSPAWAVSYGVTEKLIKKFNVKTIAEIGVARGHHSAHLLEAIPDLTAYSIDPWGLHLEEHKAMYTHNTLQDDEKIYQKVVELLKPFGKRSIIIRNTSKRSITKIPEPLDMIFIDADHTYKSVKEDINLWWDKVKIDGIVSGHDYKHPHHPGVTVAVNEFFENKNLKVNEDVGNVWWVQKKENNQKTPKIKKIIRSIKYKLIMYKINLKIKTKKCCKAFFNALKSIFKAIVGENIFSKIKKIVK